MPKEMQFNITQSDVEAYEPSYTCETHFDAYGSTSINLLQALDVECAHDIEKLWVVTKFCGDRINRLFNIWVIEQYLVGLEVPPEIWDTLNFAAIMADGIIDEEEWMLIYSMLIELSQSYFDLKDNEKAQLYDRAANTINLMANDGAFKNALKVRPEGVIEKMKELILAEIAE